MKFTRNALHRAVAPASALMAGGMLCASGALAQQGGLEEIVVMAQKRAEPLQKVPIAATAITGTALEVRFARNLVDISGAIPNTSLEKEGISNYSAAFYIRGQGVLNRGPFIDPAVGVITDGMADGRVNTAVQDFLDIEAIETLRGPQGTLQGRNATAGAVLVRHYKPNVDEMEGNVGASLADYNAWDVNGMFNVPISEGTSAFRVAAKYLENDGYYKNHFNGEVDNIGGQQRFSVLPSFRWMNENWDVTLRGDVARYRDDAAVIVPLYRCQIDPRIPGVFAPDPNAAATVQPNNGLADTYIRVTAFNAAGDPNAGPNAAYDMCAKPAGNNRYDVSQDRDLPDEADLDVWGTTLEANYTMGEWGTWTYVGGYRDTEETSALDVDAGPLNINWNAENTTHWQTSHELRFASEFSDTWDFVAGAMYFQQKYDLQRVQEVQTVFTPGSPLAVPLVLNIHSEQENKQYGAFAHTNWHFGDDWTLVLAARYTYDEKDFEVCPANPVPCSGVFATGPFAGTSRTQTDSADWDDISPRVGVNWQATDNIFAYAYWARGFRAGGFNGEAANILAAGPYDPEENNTYEAGFKADLFEKQLRINGAVFYMEVDDLQRNLSRVNPFTGQVEIITQNAATAEFKGAELEGTWIVTDNFQLNATVGWLDAEYSEFCTDFNGTAPNDPSLTPCAPAEIVTIPGTPPTTATVQPADESFLPLARAPDWTGRINPTYNYESPWGTFLFSAEWVYSGKLLTNDQGAPNGLDTGLTNFDGTQIDPYRDSSEIVNASVTWHDPDRKFKVALFGRNLTDEIYYRRLSFAAPTLSFGTMNEPRTWGVEAMYKF